ncbi:MAG: YbgC/FadM family acyl-CoA thioesterase [Gammaproteobacteria bacterium]
MNNEFILPVQVFIEDTDMSGAVYHANYLNYMERGRTAWCNALGIRLEQWAYQGIHFVVRQAKVDYLVPAYWNDRLEVVSRIANRSYTYLEYQQQIRQQETKQRIFCEALIKVVCVNQQQKPRRIPAELAEGILSDN